MLGIIEITTQIWVYIRVYEFVLINTLEIYLGIVKLWKN